MPPRLKDRNFDTLIDRFARQVYGTRKGEWRLKLLKEDLQPFYQALSPLTIWDAGCGFAQISHWLAQQGHRLTLCDVSQKMLNHAKQSFADAGLTAQFHHSSAQVLAAQLPHFDLVLCHAVLEWLAEPFPTLAVIADKVKPGGHLSLLFYNRNAVVYRNVLKGGWRWQALLNNVYLGRGKRLTPPHPQFPHEVCEHLDRLGFSVIQQTGIRVFHDYLTADVLGSGDEAELWALEYEYCRLPGYRELGRYVHVLAKRG
jgi:S-adenosylmethionine-dependent methyltransferase